MKEVSKELFGKRLKCLRRSLGYSQQQFGEVLLDDGGEITNYASTISRIERGKIWPSSNILVALPKLHYRKKTVGKQLTLSPQQLLFGSDLPSVCCLAALKNSSSTAAENEAFSWQKFVAICEAAATLCPPDFPMPENEYPFDHYDDAYYAQFSAKDDEPEQSVNPCSLRLKECRKAGEMTAKEAGESLKKGTACIYRAEEKELLPSVENLIWYCQHFNVSADYILFGNYPALPEELRKLLGQYTFASQQKLLSTFVKISEKL